MPTEHRPPLHPLLVSLRNAYEAHDRALFEDLLQRVQVRIVAAPPAAAAWSQPCEQGEACMCGTYAQRRACPYVHPRSS